jgi:hypothetical protein
MNLQGHLMNLEEEFWKGDADFYRRNLVDDALMVFAEPVGVLTKDRTVETIAGAPRWVEVHLREPAVVRLAEDAAMVTYKAEARREGDDAPYSALAGSAYVRRGDSWKLAFHQQTPIPPPASP